MYEGAHCHGGLFAPSLVLGCPYGLPCYPHAFCCSFPSGEGVWMMTSYGLRLLSAINGVCLTVAVNEDDRPRIFHPHKHILLPRTTQR